MRRLYLMRHGEPAFPGGERRCLGLTDLPLSTLGRMQACLLGRELGGQGLTVFSSPLVRAVETARFLGGEALVLDGLREMSAGDWDGLSFSEIRARWPALYEARGRDRTLSIPNAEPFSEGQRRFVDAVREALARSTGDIAVVAHTTVNQSLLCHALHTERYRDFSYRQPYGSFYLFRVQGRELVPELPFVRPQPRLTPALCQALWEAAGLPPHIRAHCEAVAREAERIAGALEAAGLPLDRGLILCAALLHDLARLEPEHDAAGARLLAALGYGEAAELVRQHHDPDRETVDEAAVVYIADKCVREAERVPLRSRFEESLKRCAGPEARAAHERRARQALRIAGAINEICKREVIV